MKKSPHKNIRAVVFDYGGVVEFTPGLGEGLLKSIAESISVPIADFKNEYFKHNHLSNVWNVSWEEMIVRVVSVFDAREESKNKVLSIVKEFQSKSRLNTDLVALFPHLRRQGLKVAIFSNHTSALREKLHANGVIDLVDDVIISGEIGFQKPHKEAFDVLFERLHVEPKEVIFIDDTLKSLEKANEIGYMPILFKNNEQLKTYFHNLGIL